MNSLRRHHTTITFNTSILVNRGSLCLPPRVSPARRKTHPITSRATLRHGSHNQRTQRSPHKIDPRSCLRGWHANTFLKDPRHG